uniref:Uncharacterized protein n=1 Tax=Rhizophora mucronata TaxID=61149 RepID=A0A2P2QPJ5_RHIMU
MLQHDNHIKELNCIGTTIVTMIQHKCKHT